jgi:hypothetical protein
MSHGRELTSSVSSLALTPKHWLKAALETCRSRSHPCPAVSHLSEAEPAATGIIQIAGINKGRAGPVNEPQHHHPSDGRKRRYGDLPTAP